MVIMCTHIYTVHCTLYTVHCTMYNVHILSKKITQGYVKCAKNVIT